MKYKLKELLTIHNGKDYRQQHKAIIPVYGTGGVMTHIDAYLYTGESILLPRKGSLSNIMYVNGPFWTVDTIYWTTVNTHLVNAKYLYYYLSLLDLSSRDTGSALPSMTYNSYYELDIDLPSLSVQQKVAQSIDNIDQKIAINNTISKELESMAKTIYDYWFLQFEFPNKDGKPYKSNGGKMVWNEQLKQEIPVGWKVDNLYKIADFINGIACQKYRPLDNNHKLPVIKITEMHDGFTSKTELVRDSISKDHIINNGDILFSWSASLETMIWNYGKGGLNQHIFKVIPKNGFSLHYVYQTLSSYIVNFKRMAEARKTTMGHITQDHFKQSRIIIPPQDLINKFENIVKKLYAEITTVDEESQQLKSLRDFLLPMLMNGQVTIKD